MKSRLLILVTATGLLSNAIAEDATPARSQLTIRADQPQGTINRNIYGQFSEHLGRCIYEGIWVGEDSPIPNTRGIRNDVVAALKQLNLPVLRWPGGCFADEYHWKDGIGPREKRPQMINTHWGGVVENNHFGTHEFFDLCGQLGCEPYICGNVGSGRAQEMMEWVEYMTSDANSPMANLRRQNGRDKPWKLKYFGVGNESWGCGGNMRPEFYADNFRRCNTFVKNYPSNRIERFACGPNGPDYNWTEVLLSMAGRQMNGLSLHYYTLSSGRWNKKGAATGFTEDEWHSTLWQTLRMDEMITKHAVIMDKYDPEKRIGLVVDEWGTWYDVEPGTNPGFLYQQNTLRDALVAGINLNIFHQYCDRVTMANIAQMIDVLQAMLLTDKEKMVLTPTYHVFEMYKVHQDATLLPVELTTSDYKMGGKTVPSLHASASRDQAGRIHLSLVNLDPHHDLPVAVKLAGAEAKTITGRVLTAASMDARNTFENPDAVKPSSFTGFERKGGDIALALPAKSVVIMEIQ
jgi:alpha-N-arabinofuranosidase